MKSRLLKFLKGHILSPWWIYIIDLILVANALFLAYVVRLNFDMLEFSFGEFIVTGIWVLSVYGVSFLIFRTYRGVIRHTDLHELARLLYSCSFALILLLGMNVCGRLQLAEFVYISYGVLLIHFFMTFSMGLVFRLMVRVSYAFVSRQKGIMNVMIYGAGDLGLLALEALRKEKEGSYQVIGFIDDNPSKWNITLRDIPVVKFSKAIGMAQKKEVKMVVLAIADLSNSKKKEIIENCLQLNLEVKVLPAFGYWMTSGDYNEGIRDIRIEDLLGRNQIHLNLERIRTGLKDKVVLVSGAAGSIGSELVRHLLKFPVKNVILLDQAESALYDLQQEILSKGGCAPFELVLGDVSNLSRMRCLFDHYHPQIVFNAAAYKHVPLVEDNPYEAIRVNVGGTKVLADLSVQYGVEKFVMVSTDKAVNPTNVMGASKRICEIYLQSLSQMMAGMNLQFIITRFGNVLGSNGSVVPLFKKQIKQGGPITVTHEEITRYFMTIPEACQLVLEAGFMGKGGEIFLFDMGEPVKIADLARKMIRLSGLKPGEQIEIKYTGLRPGEKLYEELLTNEEDILPTHNEKIMIGRVCQHSYVRVNDAIVRMLNDLDETTNEKLVSQMKEIVPEFLSRNSKYSRLDKEPISQVLSKKGNFERKSIVFSENEMKEQIRGKDKIVI